METLKGQVAIITGGGTGIGRAIALALAGLGVNVALCGRSREPLEETAKAIEQLGGTCLAFPADVSQLADVTRFVETVTERFSTVDILINNAAIDGREPIHEHDVALWDQVMAINLRGPFLMARLVLPIMRARQRGQIVNISSEAGLEIYQGFGAYAVAKHAVNTLHELIQRENQELGIRVTSVCPGVVATRLNEHDVVYENCLYPEDIADLVVWVVTRRPNVKLGKPILIQTMLNPWK